MDNQSTTSKLNRYITELEEKYGSKIEIYTLYGSSEKENIDQRIAFLVTLLNIAERKGLSISEIRHKYLNYALITFAGLFTIGLSLPTKSFSSFVFAVLLILMSVFCLLDRRFHTFFHGWKKSEKILMQGISEVINNPINEIKIMRYAIDGEKEAEMFSLQPWIFYFLVVMSILLLVLNSYLIP